MKSLHDYFQEVGRAVDAFPLDRILPLRAVIADACTMRRSLYVAGNGGCATVADHFALGMSLNAMRESGHGHRAMSLSSGPMLSAAVNDFGYARMFAAQLEALGRPGDLFLALSSSGKSANLATAVAEAGRRGLVTAVLVGREGPVSGSANVRVVIGVDNPAVAEDVMMMALHWLYCSFMQAAC